MVNQIHWWDERPVPKKKDPLRGNTIPVPKKKDPLGGNTMETIGAHNP